MIFKLNITTRRSLKEGFRVFTAGNSEEETKADYSRTPEDNPTLTTIYTDSLCIKDDKGQAAAGAGIWFSQEDS